MIIIVIMQIHCVFSVQLFMYEALGMCREGEGGQLIDSGEWIQNKNGEQYSGSRKILLATGHCLR